MNTPTLIAITTELELEVERQIRRESTRPDRQRRLLSVYRHSRALRLALENWLDMSQQESH